MMRIPFFKYQGTGNDFIIIDNREMKWNLGTTQISFLCHRRLGIGADGLIFLLNKPGFDFGMTYYNADGNESTLCGNGGRCITAFARMQGIAGKKVRFHAADGQHESEIINEGYDETFIKLRMADACIGQEYRDGVSIDTGSPHFVVIRNNVTALDVVYEGRQLRHDSRFSPGGTNVDFVEIRDKELFIRTYERGVEDETLSCGTGATASALVVATGNPENDGFYAIATPGGAMTVFYKQSENHFTDIWLEGPVRQVYSGEIEIPSSLLTHPASK